MLWQRKIQNLKKPLVTIAELGEEDDELPATPTANKFCPYHLYILSLFIFVNNFMISNFEGKLQRHQLAQIRGKRMNFCYNHGTDSYIMQS